MSLNLHDPCLLGSFANERFDILQDVTGWNMYGVGATVERYGNAIIRTAYAAAATTTDGAESTENLVTTDDAWLVTGRLSSATSGNLAMFAVGPATGVVPATNAASMFLAHLTSGGAGFSTNSYLGGGYVTSGAVATNQPMMVGLGMFTRMRQVVGSSSETATKKLVAFRETEPGSGKLAVVDFYDTTIAVSLRIKVLLTRGANSVSNIQLWRRQSA